MSSLYHKGRSVLTSRNEETRRILTNRSCSVSPSWLYLPHALWPIIVLHDYPHSIWPSIKKLRFHCFFVLLDFIIFLWRFLCHLKLILNKSVCSSPVNLSSPASFLDPTRDTLKHWGKHFPPLQSTLLHIGD